MVLGSSAKRKEIFLEEDKSKARELNDLMECSKDSDEFTQSIQALKEGSQKVSVSKFCPTRWSARLLTLSTLLAKYPTVLDALDTISDSSTGDAKSDAESYIRLMESMQCLHCRSFGCPVCAELPGLSYQDPPGKAM